MRTAMGTCNHFYFLAASNSGLPISFHPSVTNILGETSDSMIGVPLFLAWSSWQRWWRKSRWNVSLL